MFEKVNPGHPDKVADRIAGAMVDMAYAVDQSPKIAVEVLIGHGRCFIVYESSVGLSEEGVLAAVRRITGVDAWELNIVHSAQDEHLAENQSEGVRCGDNGIFMGRPVTEEQAWLTESMRAMYDRMPFDGKAVVDDGRAIVCQSNADTEDVLPFIEGAIDYIVNPLGPWTGGTDVDTGATNRKLGSDMGDAVTGGGLHGKDLSKADVSVNVACHIMAQIAGQTVRACCAIGDTEIEFRSEGGACQTVPYADVVDMARDYIDGLGGFEALAEWGLV